MEGLGLAPTEQRYSPASPPSAPESGNMVRVDWWVWPVVWVAETEYLPVLAVTMPCGVSQATLVVTSVSTESGNVAVHTSSRLLPA